MSEQPDASPYAGLEHVAATAGIDVARLVVALSILRIKLRRLQSEVDALSARVEALEHERD
jgi:hypothetical protein